MAVRQLSRAEIRHAAVNGVELELAPPARHMEVVVLFEGHPVVGASIRLDSSLGRQSRRSDAGGSATFDLVEGEFPQSIAAWTEDRRVGGFRFRPPARDASLARHTVSLDRCRSLLVRCTDETGRHPANVDLLVYNLRPSPERDDPAFLEQSILKTNERGEVNFDWLPDWPKHKIGVMVNDPRWLLASSEHAGDVLEVRLRSSQYENRKLIKGHVRFPGGFAGGFLVTLKASAIQRNMRSEELCAFTDSAGDFHALVRPDITYCIQVEDESLVSKSIDMVPYESATARVQSPELSVSKGEELRINVTGGADKLPLRDVRVNLRSQHTYFPIESRSSRGVTNGKHWGATTQSDGIARTWASPGKHEAHFMIGTNPLRKEFEVIAGKVASIDFHVEDVPTTSFVRALGKLKLPIGVSANLERAEIDTGFMSGPFVHDHRVHANAQGEFEIGMTDGPTGVFALTADKQWAGHVVVDRTNQNFVVELLPTTKYFGQLLDDRGQGVANYPVRCHVKVSSDLKSAGAKSFTARTFDATTDRDGNFEFSGVPMRMQLVISTGTGLVRDDYFLGSCWLERDVVRPKDVWRLPIGSSDSASISLAKRLPTTLRNCGLAGLHTMVVLQNEQTQVFVGRNFLDEDQNRAILRYLPLLIEVPKAIEYPANQQFLAERNWPVPVDGKIFACLMSSDGTELDRMEVSISDSRAPVQIAKFLQNNAPRQVDAKVKLEAALAEARRSNKKVWARMSGPRCAPCLMLSRWMDDQKVLLSEDYVMLSIDSALDLNAEEINTRFSNGKNHGIPFHVILGGDGNVLVDSVGPLGNIGHPSRFEGIQHLKFMISKTAERLTKEDVDRLIKSLEP